MKKFLLEFQIWENNKVCNGWWEIHEHRLYNRFGGSHSYFPTDADIIVECEDWNQLDWSCLISESSPYGWIDREGKFFFFFYSKHSDLAELYLHSSEKELEHKGWIKIYRNYDRKPSLYFEYSSAKFITDSQMKTLMELGFKEDEDFL